jgi:hypothetical protein
MGARHTSARRARATRVRDMRARRARGLARARRRPTAHASPQVAPPRSGAQEGFGSEANTWEPQQNILDEQLIRDFEQRQLGCASDPITLE